MTLCSHHKLAPPALSMIIFFSGALPRPCKRVLALAAASLACHRALCAKTFEFHYGLGRHRGLPAGLHPRPCSLFNCVHFDASSSDVIFESHVTRALAATFLEIERSKVR